MLMKVDSMELQRAENNTLLARDREDSDVMVGLGWAEETTIETQNLEVELVGEKRFVPHKKSGFLQS